MKLKTSVNERILLLVLIILTVLVRLIPTSIAIDDAYITFRYARNIAEGRGFVYNPGERVLGTTTPLFTLALAGMGWIIGGDQYPEYAVILSTAADGVTLVLLYLLMRHLTDHRLPALVLCAAFALSPMIIANVVRGMEANIVMMFMTMAFWAYAAGRERVMMAAGALATLIRPDVLIGIGPLFLAHFIERVYPLFSGPDVGWRDVREWVRRVPWREWLLYLAIIAPWFIFAWAYFGQLLPETGSIKKLVYILSPEQALVRLIQHYATPFMSHEVIGIPAVIAGVFVWPGLYAVGGLAIAACDKRLIPFVLYPVLYFATFALMNILIFPWYLVPPLAAYFVCIIAGAWKILSALVEKIKALKPEIAFAPFAAFILLVPFGAWDFDPAWAPGHPTPKMNVHFTEYAYDKAARYLLDECAIQPEDMLAAGDIGVLGYVTRAVILDTVGLVTPSSKRFYPVDEALIAEAEIYAVPVGVILENDPDFIVIVETYGRRTLMQSESFTESYTLLETLPMPQMSEYKPTEGMQIFARNTPSGTACDAQAE